MEETLTALDRNTVAKKISASIVRHEKRERARVVHHTMQKTCKWCDKTTTPVVETTAGVWAVNSIKMGVSQYNVGMNASMSKSTAASKALQHARHVSVPGSKEGVRMEIKRQETPT